MGVLYKVRTDRRIRRPHPSLCEPAARIFMKFDIGGSRNKLSRKREFRANWHSSTHSTCKLTQLDPFYMQTGTARPILHANWHSSTHSTCKLTQLDPFYMQTDTARPILHAYRDSVWFFESKERPGSVTVCCVTAYAICMRLVDQLYIFTGTREFNSVCIYIYIVSSVTSRYAPLLLINAVLIVARFHVYLHSWYVGGELCNHNKHSASEVTINLNYI